MNHTNDNKNEAYGALAGLYDTIMSGVDYEAWADYVEELLNYCGDKPHFLIDLACGTGSSTLPFARRGYRVHGLDLSSTMLEQAKEKTAEVNLDITYYRQDLRNLNLPQQYDLCLLFQDGLNYLLTEEDLALALAGVNRLLKPSALFIFDLTRPSLRPGSEKDDVGWVEDDDYILIMQSSYSRRDELWTAKIVVFQQTESGLYKKYQETHQEKDYQPDLVTTLLGKAGFKLLGLYRSFSLAKAEKSDPKVTFVARKDNE